MKKVFISAGDTSGAIHASRLMRELKNISSDIEFFGIGSKEMEELGMQSLAPLNEISVVGFWEVAKKYLYFRRLFQNSVNVLKNEKIDAYIPVDYPGFNMMLASEAKKLHIPVIYYIAPQLWAWGKNRAKKITERVDKLLVVFPFEVGFFKKYSIDAEFVGHPLLDDPAFIQPVRTYSERDRNIAFLPGSRLQEIKKHMPLIIATAEILDKRIGNLKFTIAKPSSIDINHYLSDPKFRELFDFSDNSREMMNKSIAGIVKTGTSNLEAALCGMPFAMFYKTSELSYLLSKRLVNLPYISLVNILAGQFVVKEFIQNDAQPENLATEIEILLSEPGYYNKIQSEFNELRYELGSEGAAKKAAQTIAKSINL